MPSRKIARLDTNITCRSCSSCPLPSTNQVKKVIIAARTIAERIRPTLLSREVSPEEHQIMGSRINKATTSKFHNAASALDIFLLLKILIRFSMVLMVSSLRVRSGQLESALRDIPWLSSLPEREYLQQNYTIVSY